MKTSANIIYRLRRGGGGGGGRGEVKGSGTAHVLFSFCCVCCFFLVCFCLVFCFFVVFLLLF